MSRQLYYGQLCISRQLYYGQLRISEQLYYGQLGTCEPLYYGQLRIYVSSGRSIRKYVGLYLNLRVYILLSYSHFCDMEQATPKDEVKDETSFRHSYAGILTQVVEVCAQVR